MSKYNVVFRSYYRRAVIDQNYVVEADSEEEAYDLAVNGNEEEYTEEVIALLNEVSSEHQYTEKIEEDDDVQNVYSNFDVDEETMAALAS